MNGFKIAFQIQNSINLCALYITGLASGDHSVARGSCVAAMRVCETCANIMANGAGGDGGGGGGDVTRQAMGHLTEVYRRGGPAAPPLRSIRRGQEPVTTILARALAAVAQAREPPAEAEAAAAELAAPAGTHTGVNSLNTAVQASLNSSRFIPRLAITDRL